MSLPAADKSVWEIKMKGGRAPLRSAGCVFSVAVYRGKQCQPAAPPAMQELAFPHTPRGVDPGHLGLFVSKGCILGSRWEGCPPLGTFFLRLCWASLFKNSPAEATPGNPVSAQDWVLFRREQRVLMALGKAPKRKPHLLMSFLS